MNEWIDVEKSKREKKSSSFTYKLSLSIFQLKKRSNQKNKIISEYVNESKNQTNKKIMILILFFHSPNLIHSQFIIAFFFCLFLFTITILLLKVNGDIDNDNDDDDGC